MINAAKSKRRIMPGNQHTRSRGGQGAEKCNSDKGDVEARSDKIETLATSRDDQGARMSHRPRPNHRTHRESSAENLRGQGAATITGQRSV